MSHLPAALYAASTLALDAKLVPTTSPFLMPLRALGPPLQRLREHMCSPEPPQAQMWLTEGRVESKIPRGQP